MSTDTKKLVREHYYVISANVYDNGDVEYTMHWDTSFDPDFPIWLEESSEWVRVSETAEISTTDGVIFNKLAKLIKE